MYTHTYIYIYTYIYPFRACKNGQIQPPDLVQRGVEYGKYSIEYLLIRV